MHPARDRSIDEVMYLAMERVSDVKHEYRSGEMWAMAGASPQLLAVRSGAAARGATIAISAGSQ
jgi:hypothetical protein